MSDISKRLAALSPEKRAQLAERLQKEAALQSKQSERTVIPKRATQADGEYQLSSAQKRMWFLHQLNPESPLYNMPLLMLRLRGSLNRTALEQSLQTLEMRHEVLRTTFLSREGTPFQKIGAPGKLTIAFRDLSDRTEEQRERHLLEWAREEANRPFALEQGGLIRVTLIKLQEQEHALFSMMHHIISDGESFGLFVSELSALYNAFATGQASPLPELTVQYADYAAWQLEQLESKEIKAQLDYWKKQLSGPLPVLELPSDRPRASERSYKGEKANAQLPREVTQRLHAWCRQEGVTPFMALLAVFNVLLYRYTGQEDIVVGSAINNRNRTELERVIGFFVNTLVLRTQLTSELSFGALVKQVRDTALDAYAHQEVPLEKLVEELLQDREGQASLFNTMFAYQTLPKSNLSLHALDVESRVMTSETTRFDLLFSLTETENGINALLEYDTDLFSAAFVEQMFRHFQTLLVAALDNPAQSIAELPLLEQGERSELLALAGPVRDELLTDVPLHRLFEAQVERTPDHVAVVFEGKALSYRELNERSDALASKLLHAGVQREQVVGVLMERSLETVVAVLAVLKAGGAYLPLDSKYPLARLRYLLEDAGVSMLLINDAVAERVQDLGDAVQMVTVRVEECVAGAEDESERHSAVQSTDLAYLIYTSGSTGQPKGVQVEHRQITHYALAIAERLGMAATDSHAFVLSLAADAGNTVFFPALLTGGTLHVVSEDRALDPQGLAEYFAEHGIDWIKIAPSHLIALQNEVGVSRLLPRKGLVLGGEASRFEWVRSLFAEASCAIYNHYGPTETTVGVVTYRVEAEDVAHNHALTPLAEPLPNTQLYVLDKCLQPVPLGVPGILYIGGAGVTRGYLNRPELTAERFIAHPFDGAGRLYNTGDLVRRLADGKLEYLGRADDQVKIRGFRIELGEVEAELAQHPAVKEATLLTVEITPGDRRLYAYVAVRDASVSMEELRRFLAERLPDYMVPSEIIEVETLPRAGNGKVDRAALPKPQAGTATRTTSPEDVELLKQQDAANMQFEEIVAGIFCQVLQVSHVELDDNFFKLGGHSLLATQVLSRIRKAFGVKLPLRTLFDHPTLRKMSALVRQATHSGQQADLPPITRVEQTEELPLSFAQQRLWFFNQLDPQSPFYNMPLTLRLEGALDVDVLTRSFTRIIERHSSLRTVFALRDGQPVQRIQPPQQTAIEVVDLTDSSDAEREAVAISLVTAESRRPFDLTAGPLLRIHLYRLSATSHVLLINMHHIISDGWSNSVLLRELQQSYSAYLRNQEPQLPDVSVQYVDFAVWQRDWMSGELLDEQLRYWTQELSDTPPLLHLPTDRPRPPVQSFRGKTCQHLLKPELSERLQAFSRQQGVTLYMTMLAAFQTMLYRYTGQEDILIGSPIAGRNRAEVEEVIGFFVNTLVLRSKLSGDLTFEKLLKRTRDNTLSAFAHQDLPYEKLVEVLQPERSLAYNPLIQVSFALQNHHGAFSLPNLEITGFATEWSTSKFDLSLIVIPRGDSLLTAFEYNTDLFDEATVQRMLANYAILLEGIVTAPQAKVAALPLLTEQERHQQLVAWNETEVPLLNTTVHERFETVAANLPNNIAVMFGNQEITYRELNERANRLARYLQTHGIEQGDVVGIYLERSAEVVIAILAVLKAGAVYVPLDPAMPRDRLAFQIEDAEVKVLISQSELLEALSFADQRVICLAQEQAQIDTLDGANLLVNMSPEALAYIIYTSGSTGRPKGVMIRHVGVVNLTQAAIKRFDITEKSRVGQFATISFDGSVYQMFVPLHAGAAVCVLTREEQLSVDDFAKMARARGVSWMDAPPVLFDALDPADVPTLQTIVCGGERLPLHVARKWSQDRRFYNGFGPTEATVITSWHLVEHIDELAQSIPIGRPLENMQMYVLDQQLEPTPIGVTGELYIGGIGLAVGYRNREDLTAERFIAHPFRPGERLYKSGDMVRRLPNGDIEHLGRTDYQVKIRGVRIEPEEIELRLNRHPSVAEAVVLTPEDSNGQNVLVAYVVPAVENFRMEDVRANLRSSLPAYMMPTHFVEMESMPRNQSRKIDRSRLPGLDSLVADRGREFVAPATPEETHMIELWADVLKQEPEAISMDDNFFLIGGHSMLATQLIARIREAFAVDLPLLTIFEAPTANGLLAAILTCKLQGAGDLSALMSEFDDMSDEEIEALLAKELTQN